MSQTSPWSMAWLVLAAVGCQAHVPASPAGPRSAAPAPTAMAFASTPAHLPSLDEQRCALAERWLERSRALAASRRPLRGMAWAERARVYCPSLASRAQAEVATHRQTLETLERDSTEPLDALLEQVRGQTKPLAPELAERVLARLMAATGETPRLVPALGARAGWSAWSLSWFVDGKRFAVAHSDGTSILAAPNLDELERWPWSTTKSPENGLVAASTKGVWARVTAGAHVEALGTTVRAIGQQPLAEPRFLEFSPNGELLVIDSGNERLQLLRVGTFEPIRTLTLPKSTDPDAVNGSIVAARFSLDSRRLAVVADAGPLFAIFDIASGRLLQSWRNPQPRWNQYWAPSISPDLSRVAWGQLSSLEVLEMPSGRGPSRLFYACHSGARAQATVMLPSGSQLVSAGGYDQWPHEFCIVDTNSLRKQATLESTGSAVALAVSRDGSLLASAGTSINLWELRAKRLLGSTLSTGPDASHRLGALLSPGGRVIASTDEWLELRGEAPATSNRLAVPEGRRNAWSLGFVSTDKVLANIDETWLHLLGIPDLRPKGRFTRGFGFVLSADASRVALGEYQHLRIWDTASGDCVIDEPLKGSPRALGGSFEGGWLAFTVNDELSLYHLERHELKSTGVVRTQAAAFAPVASGQRLIVAAEVGLEMLEVPRGGRARPLPTELGAVTSLLLDPTSTRVAAQNCHGQVELWTAQGDRLWQSSAAADDPSRRCADKASSPVQMQFSSNGGMLVLNDSSGGIALNATTGVVELRVTTSYSDEFVLVEGQHGDVQLLGGSPKRELVCLVGHYALPPELCLERLEWENMSREVFGLEGT